MAFTPAHAAAAVVIHRASDERLPLSALVVGSLVPDVEYYVRVGGGGDLGHSLIGAFVFCLPIGLAVVWLLHGPLYRPLWEFAPAALRTRIPPEPEAVFRCFPDGRPTLVCEALLAGILSHLAWDSATHYGGALTRRIALLRRHWADLGGQHLRGNEVVMLVTSALGLAYLAHRLAVWYRSSATDAPAPASSLSEPLRRRIHGGLLVVSVCAGLTLSVDRVGCPHSPQLAIAFVRAFWLGALSAGGFGTAAALAVVLSLCRPGDGRAILLTTHVRDVDATRP